MLKIHEFYMREALKEAKRASEEDEVPVGCVIVHEGRIIAKGRNQVEKLKDPSAHAEMLALTSATNFLESKWLTKAAIYVTVEPCSMCAGDLVLARIGNVIFSAPDPKRGAWGSVINIANNKKLNHRIDIKQGILAPECALLLKEFFKKKRSR